MRSIASPAVLLLAIGITACGRDAPTAPPTEPLAPRLDRSAAHCQNLAGTVEARFLTEQEREQLPGYAAGADIGGTLFDAAGEPLGEAYAWIDDMRPAGQGAVHVEMRHRYRIDGSLLDTEDRGVLAPIDPPLFRFNNRLEVVGGTGAFDGASGIIRAHGTVVVGGDIELGYHGRVCA